MVFRKILQKSDGIEGDNASKNIERDLIDVATTFSCVEPINSSTTSSQSTWYDQEKPAEPTRSGKSCNSGQKNCEKNE